MTDVPESEPLPEARAEAASSIDEREVRDVRDDAPAAHRHLMLVGGVYAYRVLASFLVALPAAAAIGGPTANWPRGQAELFDPGGVMLVETLRMSRRLVTPIALSTAPLAAIVAIAGVIPLAALLAGLGRSGRPTVRWLAEQAGARAGTLAVLFALGALAQALAAVIVILIGGKIVGAWTTLTTPTSDVAVIAVMAVAGAVALAIGVLRDLASVAAVREQTGFYLASARAIACARSAAGRAIVAWAWRAALGVGAIAVAAWLTPSGARSTGAAIAAGALLHQAAVAGATFARASWLAKAMRIHDEVARRA